MHVISFKLCAPLEIPLVTSRVKVHSNYLLKYTHTTYIFFNLGIHLYKQSVSQTGTHTNRHTNLLIKCYLTLQIFLHIALEVSNSVFLEVVHLGQYCVRGYVSTRLHLFYLTISVLASVLLDLGRETLNKA